MNKDWNQIANCRIFMHKINVHEILQGKLPVPPHCFIGNDCKNNHGMCGKTVRYIATNYCVICGRRNEKKARYKKKGGNRDTTALQHYEEKQNKDDEDLW